MFLISTSAANYALTGYELKVNWERGNILKEWNGIWKFKQVLNVRANCIHLSL